MKRKLPAAALASAILLAPPVMADSYASPPGTTPEAAAIGHIFFSVCHPTAPALLEDRIALAETTFGWQPVDLGTDHAFQTPDGAITVTLDGNPLAATCAMTVPTEIGEDGFAIYEGLEAHLSDDLNGDLPEGQFNDAGGVTWEWEADNSFTLSYIETPQGLTLTLEAQ